MSSASAASSATSGRRPLDCGRARVPHFGVEALLTNPDLPLPDDPTALQGIYTIIAGAFTNEGRKDMPMSMPGLLSMSGASIQSAASAGRPPERSP